MKSKKTEENLNISLFNQKDKDYLQMDLEKIQEIMYVITSYMI